ncbi:hypothetical protein VTP01DRAFT_3753 [Rhizomucor pusillus]|uniref:uncharacterized protein n=1 Tax=Rhizomucor pusillus TaxID=4840 RepID=UPI003742B45D
MMDNLVARHSILNLDDEYIKCLLHHSGAALQRHAACNSKVHTTSIELRKIVRQDVLDGDTFDPEIHLDFVESFTRHLLGLILSPRNPMRQESVERNVVINTKIQILNRLLLSKNDLVDLQ